MPLTIIAGARLQGYPAAGTTFWGVILFTIVLLPFVPVVWGDVDLASVSPDAWAASLYLAIGVTIVGYTLWYWALGRGGIARIGSFQFLQPVSGVVLVGRTVDPLIPCCVGAGACGDLVCPEGELARRELH